MQLLQSMCDTGWDTQFNSIWFIFLSALLFEHSLLSIGIYTLTELKKNPTPKQNEMGGKSNFVAH